MEVKKRYYRKHVNFFSLIQKVKLWPSRQGMLHGIQSIQVMGDQAEIITHCSERFVVRNSKNSRAARWLRNKWFSKACGVCSVPEWKLEKYAGTVFKRRMGSHLLGEKSENKSVK